MEHIAKMRTFTSSAICTDKMLNQQAVLRDKVLFRLLKTKGPTVANICEKLKYNARNIAILSEDELCELWRHMKLILVDAQKLCVKNQDNTVVSKEHRMVVKLIRIITSMALDTILRNTFIPNVLLEVVIILHSVILPRIEDKRVKDEIIFCLENWWKMNMIWKEKVIMNVLKYLIDGAESSPKYIKRLLDIKSALHLIKGTDSTKALALVRKKSILALTEGRELISYLFTLGQSWILDIHNYIKTMLENAERSEIISYADLYAMAWLNGTPATKKQIVENCIQDIIFHALRTPRSSINRNKLGNNLFIFLKVLHRYQNKRVKKMIYDQYKGVLWEHLKAPGSTIRCNAAEILFAAYPMQQTYSTRSIITAYIQEQHSAMTNLLNDNNSEVCIVTLRAMSLLLKKQWQGVPDSVIQEWLNIMLNHSKETPSPQVRLSVFLALEEITYNVHATSMLKRFLPKFANSIYDENICVAEAFVKFIRHIQDNTEMSYTDLIPLPYLLERLNGTLESPLLQMLVELLLRDVISANVPREKAVNKLVEIGLNNLDALRKLLLHSKYVIDWNTSVQLIVNLLSMIKHELGTSCNERNRRRSKRLKTSNSSTVKNLSNSRETKSATSVPDEHMYVVLDILAILFVTTNKNAETSDEAKRMEKLLSTITSALPKLYNCIKEPLAKQTVVFMFSLVSPTSLSDNVELLNSFLAEFRCSDITNDTILTIIHVLIKWEKVDAILGLLTEIVASAGTNLHNMQDNFDQLNLSLRILKCLLQAEFHSTLLDKYYAELLKFWETLHVLRSIIENKSEKADDPAKDTSRTCLCCEDNFCLQSSKVTDLVLGYFNEYVTILLLVHKTDVFDAPEHFSDLLDWTQREICSHMPKTDKVKNNLFDVALLKIIFSKCNLSLKQLYVTPKLCCDIGLLYIRCIQSPCGIMFIREHLTVMLGLLEYSKLAYAHNECNLLNVVMPNMLSAQMIRLVTYAEDVIQTHTNELRMLPSIIQKYYSVIESSSKEQSRHLPYMTIVFNAVVSCVSKEIFTKQNSSTKPANILKQKLPHLADKLLRILLYTKKYQMVYIQILERAITEYTQIDMLSALLIVEKTMRMQVKISTLRLQEIALTAKSQNHNKSGGFVDDAIKVVIEAILA